LAAVFSMSIPLAAEQAGGSRQPAGAPTPPDKIAEAYNQFLLGHRLEEKDDESGAIAAFKRAMELDPNAAEIPAELASVYLRQNKVQDAMAAAEQALKVAPASREANRVLGTVYAALSEATRENGRGRNANRADENLTKAIHHFELATDKSAGGDADPNVRATLARLYVRAAMYDKAIPLLSDLVNQEPTWQDGPMMLAEAYAGAGRTADAIAWLEQRTAEDERLLPALADFYERAEALEARHDYQAVVDELAPIVSEFRGKTADTSFDVSILLPHLGFAYQELGQADKAIATFEEARKLSPDDPAIASYLVEAN